MLGPIAVGGLGGSGTRVVARVLQSLGVYMGSNLNTTLDNLWFTLLMKRPGLKAKRGNVSKPLAIFEMAMTHGIRGVPTPAEESIIADAFEEHLGDITYSQVLSLRESVSSVWSWWGFKEPCASFWVEQIATHFPNAHFVHVIRNGQDMCYSGTMKREFRHWGALYGVPTSVPDEDDLLRFWVNANREAITAGKRLLGGRFHLVRFEDLCQNPAQYVERLAQIVGVNPTAERVAELCEPIHVPDTIGRGRVAAHV